MSWLDEYESIGEWHSFHKWMMKYSRLSLEPVDLVFVARHDESRRKCDDKHWTISPSVSMPFMCEMMKLVSVYLMLVAFLEDSTSYICNIPWIYRIIASLLCVMMFLGSKSNGIPLKYNNVMWMKYSIGMEAKHRVYMLRWKRSQC